MTDKNLCSCLRPFDLDIVSLSCPQHGHKVATDPSILHVTGQDLQYIAGLRAAPIPIVAEALGEFDLAPPAGMLAADTAIGRIIEAEPVILRPYTPKAQLTEDIAHQSCSCDMPSFYGHDTGCELHPAPILADPLQMLVAATQLISDQPTTEQWQTIKKAIIGLVPSPFRS